MRGAGRRLAAPETFDAKSDNVAAVIFVNHVDGGRFREIDQIGAARPRRSCFLRVLAFRNARGG
jgi:hypothetical protein